MSDTPDYTPLSYPDDTTHVYFAHPISDFDTDLAADLLDTIDDFCADRYDDHTIVNPADDPHPENYQHWKSEHGDGMAYYTEEVLPHMDAGVFLPFPDGTYGAGTATEIACLISDLGTADMFKPVYEIGRDGTIEPLVTPLPPAETGERLDALLDAE